MTGYHVWVMFGVGMLQLMALMWSVASHAADQSVGTWVRAAGPHPDAVGLIARWKEPERPLSVAFSQAFLTSVQLEISDAVAAQQVAVAAGCVSKVEVEFLEPPLVAGSSDEETFQRSAFRMESLQCLSSGTAAAAAEVYHSREFRLAVMPGLTSYRHAGGQVCLETEGMMGVVDPTETCFVVRDLKADGVEARHARLASSGSGDDIQIVYAREGVVAFFDRPDGGVAVYRLIYTRGRDLGALQRSVLTRVAAGAQRRIGAELESRLR